MQNFYVYQYSHNGVPLYVGKGKGKRAADHLSPFVLRTAKTAWARKVCELVLAGTPPICEILHNFSCEKEAFAKERELILKFGRIDLGTGTLFNSANGGAGSFGHTMSKEGREKVRKGMTGRHPGNQFALGLTHTEETKLRISASLKGRKESAETRAKKSKALAHQVEGFILKAREFVKETWWGPHCKITYLGKTKRQSKGATHRLYDVELDGIVVLRTITDFRQGSCPKEFAHLKAKYT